MVGVCCCCGVWIVGIVAVLAGGFEWVIGCRLSKGMGFGYSIPTCPVRCQNSERC